MKACGIIAEYNPFHNGHAYQLQKAKEMSGADVIVVCMSGNFLQRGEPAIVDKWTRAQMALKNGADIVIELPVTFSVQPADYFARGGVGLLQSMKVDALSFGAEKGEASDFLNAAQQYREKEEEIDGVFRLQSNKGLSYPNKIHQAIQTVLPDLPLDLSEPNNTLGFAYAKENLLYSKPMEMYVVPRKSAQHREVDLSSGEIASATAIRKKMLENQHSENKLEDIRPYLPATSFEELENEPFYHWEHLWPLLRYQLSVQPPSQLKTIYQMSEGMENRMQEAVRNARTMNEFLTKVKSKRNTWTRIQRLSVYTLLQMKDQEVQNRINRPEAIHLLGFTESGQHFLNQNKKNFSLPVLTTINQKNKSFWSMDIRAGEIYRLMNPEAVKHQDFYRSPIRS